MTTSAISTVALPPDFVCRAPISLPVKTPVGLHRYPQLPAAGTASDPLPTKTSPLTFAPVGAVRRRSLSAEGMTAEIVKSTGEEQIESCIRSPMHTLVAYESGSRRAGLSIVDGLPPSSLRKITRKLTFLPAGAELREWHSQHAGIAAIYFHFNPGILREEGQGGAGTRPLVPSLFFEDEVLWETILKMKTMLTTSNDEDHRYFEALGLVLAHEVMRRPHQASPNRPFARGGLAPWQQRAVIAYIDEHLTEPITLATLAGVVRLSPHYFCRAFKQSLGMPPHRYHANRRIERSKEMLLKRDESITQIGLSLGFSEPSAFSAAFRRATGTTPRDYQRSAS